MQNMYSLGEMSNLHNGIPKPVKASTKCNIKSLRTPVYSKTAVYSKTVAHRLQEMLHKRVIALDAEPG